MNKKERLTIIIIIFVLILLNLLNIYKCPLKYIFGIPFPFCGMSRALKCFFKLKIKKAFYYHAFWPIIVILSFRYLIYLFKNIKFTKKEIYILNILGIINLIYYFYRLFFISSEIIFIDFKQSQLQKIISFIIKQ